MGTIDIDSNPRIFHKTVDIGADELVDKTPPKLTVKVSPEFLWPANHKYVTVKATVNVSDNLDPSPTFTLKSVVSNEPDKGIGDGDPANDIVIIDNKFGVFLVFGHRSPAILDALRSQGQDGVKDFHVSD